MAGRPLKFADLVLYTVAMTLSVRWIAVAAAVGPGSTLMWAAALLGFLAPLSIATAALVTRHPGAGGIYDWARAAFGPAAGFLCGWLYWTCNLPFFSGLLVFVINDLALAVGGEVGRRMLQPGIFCALAVVIAAGVAAIHAAGLGLGKWLSNLGAAAACALTVLLIVSGGLLAAQGRSATDFAHASWRIPGGADGAILWATLVFAFGGPEALALLKDEVAGGVRQVLRALAVVGAALAALYIAATLGMLAILPAAETSRLSGLPDALRRCLERLGIGAAAPAALVLVALALLGGYSAWFGVAARLPAAVGVERGLPRALAWRDPRTGAPVGAVWLQFAIVVLLVLIGQLGASLKAAYDFLVSMTVLSYTAPFVFLFAAYLQAQRRSAPAGAWSLPGGRVSAYAVGALGLATTLSAIACTLVPSPDAADKPGAVLKLVVASALLVAAGAGAYALSRRRAGLAAMEGAA